MATTALSKSQRKKIEDFVIEVFDVLDKSGTNSKYYKELFSSLTDEQFLSMIKKKYPFKFQMKQSVTEPTMSDCVEACKKTGVPLLESIYVPYLFKDKDGNPVKTAKCMVGYQHHKKVQQIVTYERR